MNKFEHGKEGATELRASAGGIGKGTRNHQGGDSKAFCKGGGIGRKAGAATTKIKMRYSHDILVF